LGGCAFLGENSSNADYGGEAKGREFSGRGLNAIRVTKVTLPDHKSGGVKALKDH